MSKTKVFLESIWVPPVYLGSLSNVEIHGVLGVSFLGFLFLLFGVYCFVFSRCFWVLPLSNVSRLLLLFLLSTLFAPLYNIVYIVTSWMEKPNLFKMIESYPRAFSPLANFHHILNQKNSQPSIQGIWTEMFSPSFASLNSTPILKSRKIWWPRTLLRHIKKTWIQCAERWWPRNICQYIVHAMNNCMLLLGSLHLETFDCSNTLSPECGVLECSRKWVI